MSNVSTVRIRKEGGQEIYESRWHLLSLYLVPCILISSDTKLCENWEHLHLWATYSRLLVIKGQDLAECLWNMLKGNISRHIHVSRCHQQPTSLLPLKEKLSASFCLRCEGENEWDICSILIVTKKLNKLMMPQKIYFGKWQFLNSLGTSIYIDFVDILERR